MANKKTYKRSWRNLLLDKRYQLRFTLFMVGISAVLISALGFWVMDQARSATQTGINNIYGNVDCSKVESVDGKDVIIEEIGAIEPDGPLEGLAEEPGRPKPAVTITDSTIEDVKEPATLSDAGGDPERDEAVAACEAAKQDRIDDLRTGEKRILQVLVLVSFLLLVGLAGYGIKMTHKVAGPLFKVSLYFDKMRNNHFGEVYNLRKGDHLFEFYEHFKSAHAGVRSMQVEDIERISAVLEAAEKANMKSKSPELKDAIEALETLKAAKEESLG
jgi:hypothetical protein